MEWTVTVNEEHQFAEIVTSGIADKAGSLEMAKAIASTMNKHKISRILIDHRNVDSISGGPLGTYSRPKHFQEMGVVIGIRVAEVIRPEHKDFFRFLETVCLNRGYRFSIFDNKKSALEWLLKT